MRCDRIWLNARLATLAPTLPGLGIVEDGVIAAHEGLLLYAGPAADAPPGLTALQTDDCAGRWITPGLIDCHTHLVHAGDRSNEFEQMLKGVTAEAITRSGGGLMATVNATRAASEAQLVAESLKRLDALIAEGLTTIEIKSGYGLSLDHERRQLRAARALARERAVTVTTTCLSAHATPPAFSGRPDAYIDEVCEHIIPALAQDQLIDAVDVFCDRSGFTAAQTRRVFETAQQLGLRVKVHAEQFANGGGAHLAAEFAALSADHLEYADEEDVRALAAAGTVGVLLPATHHFLRASRLPPLPQLRANGVALALASDCNPGTAPQSSLLRAMTLAATVFGMTVDECIAGVTRVAARALGMSARVGTLEAGKQCDLAIWDIETPAQLVHGTGSSPLHARVWKGN